MPYEYNPNIPYPVVLPCGHHQTYSTEYGNKPTKPSSRPRSKTIERGNLRDYTATKPTSLGKAGTSPSTAIPLCCSTHTISPEEGAYHSYQSPTDDFADVFASCSSSKHGSKLRERQNIRTNQGCTTSSCIDGECYVSTKLVRKNINIPIYTHLY